jgi:hypothetical protein
MSQVFLENFRHFNQVLIFFIKLSQFLILRSGKTSNNVDSNPKSSPVGAIHQLPHSVKRGFDTPKFSNTATAIVMLIWRSPRQKKRFDRAFVMVDFRHEIFFVNSCYAYGF